MDVNLPEKWDANYEQGTDGWDLGRPTPVFQRLLQNQSLPLGRIIVLGAGRGYDDSTVNLRVMVFKSLRWIFPRRLFRRCTALPARMRP